MTQANNVAIESSQINSSGVLQPAGGGTGTASGVTDFKNRIINGAMVIDQRNNGASVTPTTSQYLVDRWFAAQTTASKFSAQQNAGAVTPPAGFTNYLGMTSLSAYSITSSDVFYVQQRIEGFNIADLAWGTANAKTVTLSFWVYSSLTGTFGGALNSGAFNYCYPFNYTISTANTWQQISVTIAGPTSGTWYTNNSIGLGIAFSLGTGSASSGTAGSWSSSTYYSATGATSVVGTNGATFYITGVQLEVGSSATNFAYRSYGTELALCQRYYWKQGGSAAGGPYQPAEIGYCPSTTAISLFIHYPARMRVTPSIGYGGSSPLVSSFGGIIADQLTIDQALLSVAGTGFTAGQVFKFLGNADTTTFISYSSEL